MTVSQRLGQVRRYCADIARWFWTPPVTLSFGATALVVLACFFLVSCFERQVRLSGIILQLFGVAVAAIGLRDTRRAFNDEPTAWQSIRQWWTGRPRFGPRGFVLHAEAASISFSGGSARIRINSGPQTSLDQRVAMLEQQHLALFDEVGQLSGDMKKRTDELSQSLEAEKRERIDGDSSTKNQLRTAIAQGLPLGRLGVVFFMIGIIAGTASPEIAVIFGRSACQ